MLVTHNTKDFEWMDVKLLDPFEYESPVLKHLKDQERKRAGR